MSNFYVQCAVVFGGIFVCLVAVMFCSWKAMDAANQRATLPRQPLSEPGLNAYARSHVTSPGAHALLDEVERGRHRSVLDVIDGCDCWTCERQRQAQ